MSIRADLDNMRERVNAATEGPWEAYRRDDHPRLRDMLGIQQLFATDPAPRILEDADLNPRNAEFIAHARTDLPRLLDAVDKVLELHKPFDVGTEMQWCAECYVNDDPAEVEWPCPTYTAITTALEGK